MAGPDGSGPDRGNARPAKARRKPRKGSTVKPGKTTPKRTAAKAKVAEPASKAEPRRRRVPLPPVVLATADPSLGRMLSFAFEQMRLPFRLLSSGSVVLNELLAMRVGAQAPVVVLDVDLPGVDGHAILERIGVARPDTFMILVLSSHADESVQVRSVLAGALDHVAKPFNIRVLMAKVQRWVTMAEHLAGAA